MTKSDKQRILTKAIHKAIDGGWVYKPEQLLGFSLPIDGVVREFNPDKAVAASWQQIIYSKDFAQALWGETKQHTDEQGITSYDHTTGWKYHLKNMVVADDPIAYLGQNL